jgi:hypothetical protein
MKIDHMVVTVCALSALSLSICIVDATSAHLKMHRLTTNNSKKNVRGGSTIEFGRSILNSHEAQAV